MLTYSASLSRHLDWLQGCLLIRLSHPSGTSLRNVSKTARQQVGSCDTGYCSFFLSFCFFFFVHEWARRPKYPLVRSSIFLWLFLLIVAVLSYRILSVCMNLVEIRIKFTLTNISFQCGSVQFLRHTFHWWIVVSAHFPQQQVFLNSSFRFEQQQNQSNKRRREKEKKELTKQYNQTNWWNKSET